MADLSTPVIVSVVEVGGSPPTHLRITFDYDIVAGSDLEGFLLLVDDEEIVVPVWTIPPAQDIENPQDDGGTPVQRRVVLYEIATGFVSDWETFEEYPVGAVSSMTRGGAGWDGGWSKVETDIGYKNYGDDFESYAEGLNPSLNGGLGWDGSWNGQ